MLRLLILICLQLLCIALIKGKECDTDEFTCANGSCLHMKWRCDGSPDCYDESDEIGCPKMTCPDDYFRCEDGQCIVDRWMCDGSADCNDKSDENHEVCGNKTCDGYHCLGNDMCIPEAWKCDGKADCHKEDDEKDCDNSCSENEFTCENKHCIDLKWYCDGHEDCVDGSDEIDCGGCDEGEFVCKNGQCIIYQWHCDGDTDCKDGSDESNCTFKELSYQTCDSTMFQCETPQNEAKCIASAWRCDGDSDCPDDSDEKGCEGIITCASNKMLCGKDHYCLNKEFFCDQQEDCLDGSDEKNCNYTVTAAPNCEANEFDCKGDGTRCILDGYKCDGNDDCGNFADEQNCPKSNMCTGKNGGCQHICVPISSHPGRVCECNSGYELVNGSDTDCQDIDECKIRGTCSQICVNTKGSYKCECEEDYVLTDHRYCKANSDSHPELILSDDYDIRRYELSTFHYTLLLDENRVSGAVAMDFDIRNNMVYWAGAHSEGVLSADLKTRAVTPVLSEHVKTPDGLAVDWVHGNLYISDTGHDHIVVSRLDGSNSKVLLSGDMDEPRALVVDPYHGWMYWTDWGSDPKIEKCGMNGKERKAIVTEDIVWPNGLAIDYVDNRLYWVDAKMHYIGSTDLDGQDFRLVVKGHRYLGHPFAVTVFEDYIYWTDWIDNAVYKMSKFGTGETNAVALNLKTPMDIHVYHIYRQPSKINYCGINYGGCSHLCLPVPQHVTGHHIVKKSECACPNSMVLEDGFNCVNSTSTEGVTKKPAAKPSTPDTEGNPNRPNVPKLTTAKLAVTPKPAVTEKITTEVKPAEKETTEKSEEHTFKYVETTEQPKETTEGKNVNGTKLSSEGSGSPIGHVAGIAVAVILGVSICLGIVMFIVVRRYKKKNVKSMNFDNPVYRKTTTDDQLIMDKDAANSRSERESMQPLNGEPEIV